MRRTLVSGVLKGTVDKSIVRELLCGEFLLHLGLRGGDVQNKREAQLTLLP
jgi:hypothetical protein